MRKTSYIIALLIFAAFLACKSDKEEKKPILTREGEEVEVKYASGLNIVDFGDHMIITVENPWPNADRTYRYLLAEEGADVPQDIKFDERIKIPVEKIVVTSTTHIPSLEILEAEKLLIGFPGLDYISSEKTRKLISEGKIKEIGKNEALNTESLLDLKPDVVIGFSIDGSNKSFNTLQKSGIPVVFNADWTESSPLGKVEWIKFFGAFLGKMEAANAFFEEVEKEYLAARELAKEAKETPTVVAGAMYKDQWYLPAGNSWQALFIKDANANYLFGQTEGTGSLSLSFETVLAEAAHADFWVGPAQFTSYEELRNASQHYTRFEAFKNQNIYTFASEKGETGGVVFYELAPMRPDLVLKDLISIFHPQLLPDYNTTFYKPME
ncbi:ABC transporter substrate-binding protein [Salinimicrobium sp. TH3]|uniref:ABC transporter substrate-binding protein n=1 Tax=Salinimicrobium sp. TH3 TaxID=2997342 RepID=UPI0022746236|nr:ABC transporter substrate-binding protein [Salinimicrobium sp. TH3]MCY2688173.1 ABC transporter substrate-binding protein [Salinimicrobium sp. TH3]